MPKIILFTKIKASRNIVFDLSRSIDLHKKTFSQTNETAIEGRLEGLIKLNETVTWRGKHFGFYQTHTSKITAYETNTYFVDEMLSGTFKTFKHEHYFFEKKEETIMVDVINYTSPLGVLGKLADILFLEKYMKNLISGRNKTIQKCAESGDFSIC